MAKPQQNDRMLDSEKVADSFGKIRLSVFAHSAFITVGMMAALGGGGYALDQALGNEYLFMVIGLVLSFILAQVLLVRKASKIVQNKVQH